MKDQYFAVINDYRKYALLRALCRNDTHLCVCWMLTPDVAGPDGKKTKYLKQPSKWRDCDCELFQLLKQAVPGNGRVAWAEEVRLLRSACFFSRLLNDSKEQRERYFEEFLRCAKSSEIVFFGPDNGLQVPSRPYGRKDSSKYLYWEELEATWDAGHPFSCTSTSGAKKERNFIAKVAADLQARTSVGQVVAFRSPH